jgi:hypothetical protein
MIPKRAGNSKICSIRAWCPLNILQATIISQLHGRRFTESASDQSPYDSDLHPYTLRFRHHSPPPPFTLRGDASPPSTQPIPPLCNFLHLLELPKFHLLKLSLDLGNITHFLKWSCRLKHLFFWQGNWQKVHYSYCYNFDGFN